MSAPASPNLQYKVPRINPLEVKSLYGALGGIITYKEWRLGSHCRVLFEKHPLGCTCSYCRDGEVGLVLPECKAWNANRSIRWYWRGKLNVIRWTLPKSRKLKQQELSQALVAKMIELGGDYDETG